MTQIEAATEPPATPPSPDDDTPFAPPTDVTPQRLFIAFSVMALTGFGGVMPIALHYMVDKKRWMTARDFVETVAISQSLPGPGICNMSVMIGHRHAGARGAMAALAGITVLPLVIVIAVGILYQHYGDLALVQKALRGMSLVAAGLLVASAIRLASALPLTWSSAVFCGLTLIGLNILRWPLVGVFFALAPITLYLAYQRKK